MYTILAYAIPEESRHIMQTALNEKASIEFCSDLDSYFEKLKRHEYDTLFLFMEDVDSDMDLLEKTYQRTPHTPIIIVSQEEKTELVVEALKNGASDYLVHPVSIARFEVATRRAMENRALRNEIAYLRHKQDIVYHFDDVIAFSPNMQQVLKSLEKFAKTDSTILITGATGTGKSFLSGTVHYNSPRQQKPFIKINCANIPEDLLESELFGHEKGAFTGAEKLRIGRFEQASGGTLFLDEIGEISLGLQTKLLRVLEEKCFERVGGNKTIYADVRVIAATNKDLLEQISHGKFREDLYYRINVLPIRLPDLRERRQCLLPLAQYFLRKYAKSLSSDVRGFTDRALTQIREYSWPGNIRQLANTIERAVILEDDELVDTHNLSLPSERGRGEATDSSKEGAKGSLVDQEKDLILKALEECLWVQKNAAEKLGISPRSLNYKVKKFGITHPHWRKHR
ncbi:MAG: sigma-54 dependent transcriptional regulator [Proteobacteria bacterium]|nr:sigma-54 dependent transcriptional regulator [Pseudomonadota bacterium]MBU1419842.1 sigma-54 dependent transcriptional regulator [Pseudomonadota bacterium]MBU1454635.1 sigma-54 dependent transcriptional regulator [Pseudomonadota bacterium]